MRPFLALAGIAVVALFSRDKRDVLEPAGFFERHGARLGLWADPVRRAWLCALCLHEGPGATQRLRQCVREEVAALHRQAGGRRAPGVDASLLGTILRSDGRRQATYAGKPLYYYVGDRKPLQVLCQNVREFGGLWLVVRPNGTLVR